MVDLWKSTSSEHALIASENAAVFNTSPFLTAPYSKMLKVRLGKVGTTMDSSISLARSQTSEVVVVAEE